MAEIISSSNISRHNVDKYNFKVLAIGSSKKPNLKAFGKEQSQEHLAQKSNQTDEAQKVATQPKEPKKQDSKDSIIESLLKKTDEMSSNFIKLQMKLENMQEEHKKELEQIRESAFLEGEAKGKEEAAKECQAQYEQTLNLFADSISKLEQKATHYNSSLESLKKELITAAIDIAKEVVSVEIEQNSAKVAEALATSLIEELKSASQIMLKVNPKDFANLVQKFEDLQNVKVVADAAVSEGGVIAISDIENIDAQIANRFERVKKVVLSE
ncbi:Flagellar assembly protein FliH [hydrothermal vent metagenome]|uniref:Flagellar assembly protein FliH n=1 Tax=hydrothermal vent metagenome TaxID=652676 RepID=A0A1W1C4W2_9ZZZZ